MLTMYQLPPAFDLPVSVSPYCAKLELYLRLTGREFAAEQGNLFKSPNKKVPYVQFDDGTVMADSREIIDRLEAEGPSLDEGLPDAEGKRGRELEDDVQDAVYYACLYARFVDPAGWEHQKPTVKKLVPWILSPILVRVIRSSQVKLCARNGFADDTRYAEAVDVLSRVSAQLGDRPFMLGDEPRVADCGVWANVMQVSQTLSDNPVRRAARQDDKLMAYVDRLADAAKLDLPPLR